MQEYKEWKEDASEYYKIYWYLENKIRLYGIHNPELIKHCFILKRVSYFTYVLKNISVFSNTFTPYELSYSYDSCYFTKDILSKLLNMEITKSKIIFRNTDL